ncbi:efflux RND transporter periplasmic adaptor subunit [Gluconobacter cadivus]|uniref:Efflux RND transporter periplasmic adaptor subunit n=1 Tax=Gluconobacter cadivus TaxID=2728101 RepID=A0ABR9YXM5_9PROT|nr:efflux RND transporter periplasmic adaptor subunit [Gluconobacter cadivus]MBF0889316.1 efflux RND transporter periplasmic adaptor subunit [Gluconobacter cadivus]
MKKSLFFLVLLGMSSLCFPDVGMAEKTVQISPDAFKAENIVISTAIAGTLSDHMDVPAYVALDERHVARIHPVGNGRVQEVFVTPGERIQKGTPLFKYENFSLADQEQRVNEAQAAYQQALAQESNATDTYKRGRALEGGVVSSSEVERRFSLFKTARELLRQRQAELTMERQRLARYSIQLEKGEGLVSTVTSPISGIIRTISVAQGESVSNTALPAVEIDDLSQVWVISQVDPQKAGLLASGGQQLTYISANQAPITSNITLIEASIDPRTRHVLVRSLVTNPDMALRPDMLVKTRLMTRNRVSGVLVPEVAIQTLNGRNCVFIQKSDHEFVPRNVTVATTLEGKALVTEGLKAGQKVVSQGSFVLKSQYLLAPTPDHSEARD